MILVQSLESHILVTISEGSSSQSTQESVNGGSSAHVGASYHWRQPFRKTMRCDILEDILDLISVDQQVYLWHRHTSYLTSSIASGPGWLYYRGSQSNGCEMLYDRPYVQQWQSRLHCSYIGNKILILSSCVDHWFVFSLILLRFRLSRGRALWEPHPVFAQTLGKLDVPMYKWSESNQLCLIKRSQPRVWTTGTNHANTFTHHSFLASSYINRAFINTLTIWEPEVLKWVFPSHLHGYIPAVPIVDKATGFNPQLAGHTSMRPIWCWNVAIWLPVVRGPVIM